MKYHFYTMNKFDKFTSAIDVDYESNLIVNTKITYLFSQPLLYKRQ